MHKLFPVLAFATLLSGSMALALTLIGAVMLVGSDGVSSERRWNLLRRALSYNMQLPPEPVYRLTDFYARS